MIGVDVVDVERLRSSIARLPGLMTRYFSDGERTHCDGFADPILHLAGTLAAKEAVMKAVGAVPAVAAARRIEIVREPSGAPAAHFEGRSIPISISHDGGVAVAIAIDVPL
jgi:holo-[acyl-carrier protein] synthase